MYCKRAPEVSQSGRLGRKVTATHVGDLAEPLKSAADRGRVQGLSFPCGEQTFPGDPRSTSPQKVALKYLSQIGVERDRSAGLEQRAWERHGAGI